MSSPVFLYCFPFCFFFLYGPVLSLQAEWKPVVIVSGFQTIREALGQKAENFTERLSIPLMCIIGRGKNCEGVLMASGDNGWKEQRRFCVSNLKSLGMGKKTLEKRVCEEAGYLCAELKSKEGFPFDPHDFIYTAVGNIICTLAFGDRFEYHSKNFLSLLDFVFPAKCGLRKVCNSSFLALPCLALPSQVFKNYLAVLPALDLLYLTNMSIMQHCTIYIFIIYFFNVLQAEGNTETSFNEENLIHVLFDIFVAGAETTSATLTWGLLFMVLHPEVQSDLIMLHELIFLERVHEEVDTVIGGVKSVTMEDWSNLPYTTAVIHEIQRNADIVPVTFPYVACNDTEVGGFVIPKETVVIYHLSSALKDETMWEKPHEFYPEHFLDANGQFVKREAFIPYSSGKFKRRMVAIGKEPLAKMELFIFFTSLMQHFTFYIPENAPRPSEERIFRITVFPLPFQILAFPR
uniref:Cytochrome P450 family 2 subfamily U member 1 n=1 Tax=Anolis carolinensis TaxID=28377 RepID=A0A803TKX4_ANOCA